MIYDKLEKITTYSALFSELVEYIKKTNLNTLPIGKNEISDTLFVLVNEYKTSIADTDILENHAKFIDVQVILSGEERVAVSHSYSEITKEYDQEADYELVRANGQLFRFAEKYFMIFYPGEYHRPGISVKEPALVKKLVFKVKMK